MTLLSSLSLRAEVSNTSFLSGAGAWGNALIGVTSLSDHEFALSLGGTKIPFGTEGRVFYLGERRSLAQGDSSLGQQLTADVAGCRLFATLDWQSLHRAEPTVFDVLPGSFRDVERLNVRMRDAGAFTLHLIAPEGTNLSKEILLNE